MRIFGSLLSFQADLAKQPGMRRCDLSLIDLAIAILVTVAALLLATWAASQLGNSLERTTSTNVWFHADIPRVIAYAESSKKGARFGA